MTTRLAPLRHLPICFALVLAATAVQAKVYHCTSANGPVVMQDTPCAVQNVPLPPAVPLPCELEPGERQRAIRLENQFLARYDDERAHRRAQLGDLQMIATQLHGSLARLSVLQQERRKIDIELEFYKGRSISAALRARVDANDAHFTALTDIFRNHRQAIASIETRYQCERDAYGKMWSGAPPGSSACNLPACALR